MPRTNMNLARTLTRASEMASKRAVHFVALLLVLVSYYWARPYSVSPTERMQLASRFGFQRVSLDVGRLARGPLKSSRQVHPSLERISAWISGTGAAATLGDLDGDGFENDLVLIDPRLDKPVVMSASGSNQSERYAAFVIDFPRDFPALGFDESTMSPTGSLMGDFNEDGSMDLLFYFWGRTPILLLKRDRGAAIESDSANRLGPEQFVPVELMPDLIATDAGRWFTHAAVQADFDGDGHLDLMIGNFFQDGADILNAHGKGVATVMHEGKSRARNGGGAKLLRWKSAANGAQPTVTYVDESHQLESLCGKGWVLAAGAADMDGDGLPELYIAHDFGPDRLLHNRSQPNKLGFALCEGRQGMGTPRSFVLGRDSFKGMGVGFGDVNRDGYLDIFVSNIADNWALQESHFLWVSTGDVDEFKQGIAPYRQESERYGLSRSGWGWDSVLADLDNDGTVEAIQATGFAKGTITADSKLSVLDRLLFNAGFLQHGIQRWPELQAVGTTNDRLVHDPRAWPMITAPTATLSGYDRNPVYTTTSSGRFVDISAELGLGDNFNTRGVAISDVDGDGLQDLVYANQWEPSWLLRNCSQNQNQWLAIRLLLPASDQATFQVDPIEYISSSPAIGATATIRSSHKIVNTAEVRAGTGHSGHSGQTLHFGLGHFAGDDVQVELRWRARSGQLQTRTISLKPGRHTVYLGNPT